VCFQKEELLKKELPMNPLLTGLRSLLGDESGVNNISYSTIRLEKSENENFYPIPISQKEL